MAELIGNENTRYNTNEGSAYHYLFSRTLFEICKQLDSAVVILSLLFRFTDKKKREQLVRYRADVLEKSEKKSTCSENSQGGYLTEDEIINISLKLSQKYYCGTRDNAWSKKWLNENMYSEFMTKDFATISWYDNDCLTIIKDDCLIMSILIWDGFLKKGIPETTFAIDILELTRRAMHLSCLAQKAIGHWSDKAPIIVRDTINYMKPVFEKEAIEQQTLDLFAKFGNKNSPEFRNAFQKLTGRSRPSAYDYAKRVIKKEYSQKNKPESKK
jgi:hypothetical protein